MLLEMRSSSLCFNFDDVSGARSAARVHALADIPTKCARARFLCPESSMASLPGSVRGVAPTTTLLTRT